MNGEKAAGGWSVDVDREAVVGEEDIGRKIALCQSMEAHLVADMDDESLMRMDIFDKLEGLG